MTWWSNCLYKVSSPCLDDHQFKQEELESIGELSEVCSQIVLKCLYLARDILWSVNKLASSVTKWTQACDRRQARLISYIYHTNAFRQHCHVGNTAQHFRLGLFLDSDFAVDLEDSKSTSGGVSCQSQNVQMFGYVYQNTNGLSHGPEWKIQSIFLSEICTVILQQDYYGKGKFEKVLL